MSDGSTPSGEAYGQGYKMGWRFIADEIEAANPYPASTNPRSLYQSWNRGFDLGASHATQHYEYLAEESHQ